MTGSELTKDVSMTIRIQSELKTLLSKNAGKEGRTLSQYVERALIFYLDFEKDLLDAGFEFNDSKKRVFEYQPKSQP
jgi:predicted transcriptional regulator